VTLALLNVDTSGELIFQILRLRFGCRLHSALDDIDTYRRWTKCRVIPSGVPTLEGWSRGIWSGRWKEAVDVICQRMNIGPRGHLSAAPHESSRRALYLSRVLQPCCDTVDAQK